MTPAELVAFEARVAEAFNAGQIRAPVHLSGGNEGQLIKIFEGVRRLDWVLTTWRSHYHCLLKGVPEDQLFDDILAGKSITLCYPDHRILSSAIVGGICSIALGIAWSIKKSGADEKVFCFVGDMTALGGSFHECMNYAWGHDLPVTFVVEDNKISVCTPTRELWREPKYRRPPVVMYEYDLLWPHSGAGKRVEF